MNEQITGGLLLKYIKEVAGSPGPQLVLPVGTPYSALLRPVATQKKLQNKHDVLHLTNWRNKYTHSFLTEFEATVLKTSNWLSNTIHNDNSRIIFMVDLPNGQTIGYMGLAFINWERKYGEADAIVRGEPAPKGIMLASLEVLLNWAEGSLGINDIWVRVLSDNPALKFYKRCGFVEIKRIPLKKNIENDIIYWSEDKDANNSSRKIIYHNLKKD